MDTDYSLSLDLDLGQIIEQALGQALEYREDKETLENPIILDTYELITLGYIA